MAFGRTKPARQASPMRRDGSGGEKGITLIRSLLYG
jgi:hypothetical protein